MITESGDTDITNRSLELDKWVCLVVVVGWAGLAVGTEVGVMADSALVTVTLDISLNAVACIAKRTVTVDTMVTCPTLV